MPASDGKGSPDPQGSVAPQTETLVPLETFNHQDLLTKDVKHKDVDHSEVKKVTPELAPEIKPQLRVRREFFWNGSARKVYTREDQKRVFSADMGNLHVKRKSDPGCLGFCYLNYKGLCKEVFMLIFGIVIWSVRVLLFLLRSLFEPIYSRLPCSNVPDGARRSVSECLLTWFILIAVVAYGYYYVFKNRCDFETDCITFETDTGAFVIAKSFGKATTACFILGMMFVLKPVTEYIETLPFQERWGIGWRFIHKHFMNMAVLLAMGHTIAHWKRKSKAKGPQAYEDFQLYTGITLFALWFVAGAPLWLRRLNGKLVFSRLCFPLINCFDKCFESVTTTAVRVTWKGNVSWHHLRNDRPYTHLMETLTIDRNAKVWVYCAKDHTMRLVSNDEELHSVLHAVKDPVIRLDASALDILQHDDLQPTGTPRPGSKDGNSESKVKRHSSSKAQDRKTAKAAAHAAHASGSGGLELKTLKQEKQRGLGALSRTDTKTTSNSPGGEREPAGGSGGGGGGGGGRGAPGTASSSDGGRVGLLPVLALAR